MKLINLTLQQVPGIPATLPFDKLDPHLQLITGPNGSGKSTFCRSVMNLIWPKLNNKESVTLTAVIEIDGKQYHVQREGTKVQWTQLGQPTDPPPLPQQHAARCFVLGVRDLLNEPHDKSSEHPDGRIASELRTQMAGGFDLNAIITTHFHYSTTEAKKRTKEIQELNRQINDLQANHEQLAAKEDTLADLKTRYEQAEDQAKQVTLLHQVKQWIEARDDLAVVEEKLTRFPAGMNLIKGNEREMLDHLHKTSDDLNTEINKDRQRIQQAEQTIADAELPGNEPTESDIDLLNQRRKRLDALEDTRTRLDKEIEQQQAVATQCAQAIGKNFDRNWTDPNQSWIDEADDILQQDNELKTRYAELQAGLAQLPDPTPGRSVPTDELSIAQKLLNQWLTAKPVKRSWLWLWLPITAVVLGVATVYFHTALGLTSIGFAIGGLAVGFFFFPKQSDKGRSQIQQDFGHTSIDPPASWHEQAVNDRLQAIESQLADNQHAQRNQGKRESLQQQLQTIESKQQALDQRREALAKQFGIRIEGDIARTAFSRNLIQWITANHKLAQARAERKDAEDQYQKQLNAINQTLQSFGRPACGDCISAETQIKNLDKLRTQLQQAHQALADARSQRTKHADQQQKIDQQIQEFWQKIELPPDRIDALEDRLAQLDNYQKLLGEQQRLNVNMVEYHQQFKDQPEYEQWNQQQIEDEIEKALKAQDNMRQLSEQISDINSQIKQAKGSTNLTDAMAEAESLYQQLRNEREQAMTKHAGQWLLNRVRDKFEATEKPKVLRDAEALLHKFTQNRYQLQLAADGQTFTAKDTTTNTDLALEQLSDGTRTQLLLAVRLAYAMHLDRNQPMPLFFDEVLAMADPVRFRAIATSLATFVRDYDRQVFYFSANPNDAEHWRHVLKEAKIDLTVNCIDLQNLQNQQAATPTPPKLTYQPPDPIPAPDNMSATQYAKQINVPAFDPRQSPGQTHPYYITADNLDLLHRLLTMGYTQLGPLQQMIKQPRNRLQLDPEDLERLERRIDLLYLFHDAWSIGRGKPLTADAIINADAISDTFQNRMIELAGILHWNANDFINAIENKTVEQAKGFRSDNIEQLKEYLIDHGFIDPRPELDHDQLSEHIIHQLLSRDTLDQMNIPACRQFIDELYRISNDPAGSPDN